MSATHQDEAMSAVVLYIDELKHEDEAEITAAVRDLIEAAARMYGYCTSPQQAYETLAAIALDAFNADQAARKGEAT